MNAVSLPITEVKFESTTYSLRFPASSGATIVCRDYFNNSLTEKLFVIGR